MCYFKVGAQLKACVLTGTTMTSFRMLFYPLSDSNVPQVMLVSFNFSSPSHYKINTNQSGDCSIVLRNNTATLLTLSSITISDHICVFQ